MALAYLAVAEAVEKGATAQGRALLSACYMLDGDRRMAASYVSQALSLKPDLTVEGILDIVILEHEKDREKLRAALQVAGWMGSGATARRLEAMLQGPSICILDQKKICPDPSQIT